MKIGYLKKREKKMPNHKEGFNARIKCNEAESKFEAFCESNDIMFYKFVCCRGRLKSIIQIDHRSQE